MIPYLTTLAEYSRHLNIALPRHAHFDARTFEENMPTIRRKMPPFRHEFYAIGLLGSGTSHRWHGIEDLHANLIFNSPYQLISWDIEADWNGYYLIFTHDFLMQCSFGSQLLNEFAFLKLDQVTPMRIPTELILELRLYFQHIVRELKTGGSDRLKFVESYLNLLLLSIRRLQPQAATPQPLNSHLNYTNDVQLVSRYHSLIEQKLNAPAVEPDWLSTSFYAEQLAVHPNHLNAIVKRVTGNTAKQTVQVATVRAAQTLLQRTGYTVREIGYRLGFKEASNFSAFFKRRTGTTPLRFRKQQVMSSSLGNG